MEHYLGVAREQEITQEEIDVVRSIVMAVSGGKPMMQLIEVQNRAKEKNVPVDSDCSESCF